MTFVQLVLALLLSSALGALVAALLCRWSLRKVLRGGSLKSLSELSLRVEELTSLYSSLHESHKKLVSRVGMRQLREKRASDSESDTSETSPSNSERSPTTSGDWKRRMRMKISANLLAGKHPAEGLK